MDGAFLAGQLFGSIHRLLPFGSLAMIASNDGREVTYSWHGSDSAGPFQCQRAVDLSTAIFYMALGNDGSSSAIVIVEPQAERIVQEWAKYRRDQCAAAACRDLSVWSRRNLIPFTPKLVG